MSISFKRPLRSDKQLDHETFVLMQRELERVANMVFSQDFFVRRDPVFQVALRVPQTSVKDKSFSVSWTGTIATISAGSVRFHGLSNYAVASDTLELTTNPEWLYVYHVKDHSDTGFGQSSTEPTSTGTQWRWPLVKLEKVGSSYIRNDPICHDGDINVLLPIR